MVKAVGGQDALTGASPPDAVIAIPGEGRAAAAQLLHCCSSIAALLQLNRVRTVAAQLQHCCITAAAPSRDCSDHFFNISLFDQMCGCVPVDILADGPPTNLFDRRSNFFLTIDQTAELRRQKQFDQWWSNRFGRPPGRPTADTAPPPAKPV